MDLNLSGKVAVVTGASKGIGLAITESLAREGVKVAAGALAVNAELSELSSTASVHAVAVDLSAAAGPGRLIAETVSTYGGIDIVVNNVGATRPRPDGFLSISDEEWTSTFSIDFFAALRTTRSALPHLLDRGGGAIVSVCSVNASLPDPLVIDYSAAKAALLNFSKALSKEFGGRQVRVNTVSPGPVATDLWLGSQGVASTMAKARGGQAQAMADQAAKTMVTGRFTRTQEVADLVLFLVSERTANVTGANFVIDGGLIDTV